MKILFIRVQHDAVFKKQTKTDAVMNIKFLTVLAVFLFDLF